MPQTFDGAATATTIEGAEQSIARGPVASQIAIKQLGTNGGGFYNSNSAVPFENPNGFTNFLEMLAILLIPAGQVFMFGRMAGARRQALADLRGDVRHVRDRRRGARCRSSSTARRCCAPPGSNIDQGDGQSGGNMSDKEVRYGIANTALWAVATTNASNGSVNGGHDALTAGGGAVPIVNMFTGEVIFGGVGSGLYGMVFYIVIAVFVAGLMVGRTPEYLGKKIEAREIKIAAVGALFVPTMVLVMTAISVVTDVGLASDLQPGRARLLRGALRLRLPGEQQRQRLRRLRRDRTSRLARHGRPLPRPLRPAGRGARDRRLARAEEDRARSRWARSAPTGRRSRAARSGRSSSRPA